MASKEPDPNQLAHRLIASYLRHNSYASTLSSFESEARAAGYRVIDSSDAEQEDQVDLLSVTESYLSRIHATQKQAKEDAKAQAALSVLTQSLPGPSTLPYKLVEAHSQLHTSNILTVSSIHLPRRWFDSAKAEYRSQWRRCFVTSAADKRVVISDVQSGEMVEVLEGQHKAAVLSVAQAGARTLGKYEGKERCDISMNQVLGRLLATAGMDGTVVLYDLLTAKPLQTLKLHTKFVVRVIFDESGLYLASAGYDRRINIYRAAPSADRSLFGCKVQGTSTANGDGEQQEKEEDQEEPADLSTVQYELVHSIETPSNPEAILFLNTRSPAHSEHTQWLVYTIRGDSFLHYVALPEADVISRSSTNGNSVDRAPASSGKIEASLGESLESQTQRLTLQSSEPNAAPSAGRQTDERPDLEAWEEVRFNTNPSRDDLHVSYSLLDLQLHPSGLYISAQTGDHSVSALPQTGSSPSSLSRIILLPLFSDERAATLWTGAPCSPYASPRHAWTPSGSGVWVNGEDGSVRLVDLKGKVRACVYAHGQSEQQQNAAGSVSGEMSSSVGWGRGGGGNTIVKDVATLDEVTVASCGFDRTVRICTLVTE